MAELLYTDKYVRPGCYIGQVIEPSSNIASAARIPTVIGKGSRFAVSKNATLVRSYVDSFTLDGKYKFSDTVPYKAELRYKALKDQDKATLVRDGYEVPESKWYFLDESHIVIADDEYVKDANYQFSYQSTDSTILDPAPVMDITAFNCVGDTPDARKYTENKDFFLVMQMGEITDGEGKSQSKLTFDERYEAENLFPSVEGPLNDPSQGTLVYDVSAYSGKSTVHVSFKVTALGTNEVTFGYCEGETFSTAVGTFKVKVDGRLYAVTEEETSKFYGIKVSISSISGFAVNNVYENLIVNPARIFMTAKDNRDVTIKVTKAPTENVGGSLYYTSNTPEGGFGVIELEKGTTGSFVLAGNIIVNYKNLADKETYKFSIENTNQISWNLSRLANETFKPSEIYTDVNGTVTGTCGSLYISLDGKPINEPVVYGLVGDIKAMPVMDGDEYTSYITFVSNDEDQLPVKPTASVTVAYEYKGLEPDAGSTYYVSTSHLRPMEFYNKVIFISSREEGRNLLAPATPSNELYIANEIAWDELGGTADAQIAIVQMRDSDADGVYSADDVKAAIDGCAQSKAVTDVTLLGCFEQFGYLLKMNQDANDPFALRENEVWAGCPVATQIGDVNTEGSLVYTAKSTMKLYGNDPAHGTRILVGSTWAKRSVTMESGKAQEVTMDGSFIAWALCCMRCSLATADSILRKTLVSFSDMEVFNDNENIKLGAAQIIYFSKVGTGIFRVEEDFTVDTYGFEFSIEQVTSQRLMAVRRIRKYIDESLVGVTPDSPQAGINLVTSFLMRGLNQLIGDGTISRYLDDNGNPRSIDVNTDIFVQNVESNPTQYQFGYGFYTKKVMKQFFGIYVVDKDFASTGIGNV